MEAKVKVEVKVEVEVEAEAEEGIQVLRFCGLVVLKGNKKLGGQKIEERNVLLSGLLLFHGWPGFPVGNAVVFPLDANPAQTFISGRGIVEDLHPAACTLAQAYHDLIFPVSVEIAAGWSGLSLVDVVIYPINRARVYMS